jgi:DNA invertase Pin-like site-specific DNA recombinase
MGDGQGHTGRLAAPRDDPAGAVWCDAAEQLRLIVDRLPMPGHVAGYLRGYADSLECHCTLGARADTTAGDVIASRTGRLAAYLCEPPTASCPDSAAQRRTIQIAAEMGLFAVSSWHEDTEAYSKNRRSTGLQEARAAVAAGEAGGIVVAELARLGRNSLDVLDLIERSQTEGWRIIALDCRLDSATPSGELVVETLRAARRLAWRRVPTRARRDAEPSGGRRRMRAGAESVDAALAGRIAAMRADGGSYRAIAGALNDDRVPAPGGRPWGAAAVRGVLQATRIPPVGLR